MTKHNHKAPKSGMGIRPHPWLLWALLTVLIAEALSGCLWTVEVSLMDMEGPELRSLAMIHGGFAFLSMILIGALLPQHIRIAWAARRNRGSGAIMVLIMAILAATGYGLYYGAEVIHSPVRIAHIIVGIAAISMLPLHITRGKKTRPKRHIYGQGHQS